MVWKYVSGDNYDLYQLEGFKKFFEIDLALAEKNLEYVKGFEKWGLPGYRWTLIRAQMAVEDSKANIAVVNKAIAENKKKG